jgi:hypothetical protein
LNLRVLVIWDETEKVERIFKGRGNELRNQVNGLAKGGAGGEGQRAKR